MVQEWLREKNQPPRGYRPHPERWQVNDWEQVLGRCAGEEGDLLFECESVHVTKEEEISFGTLFKNYKSSKNGYKTRDYKDCKRRNVAVALLQILQPHRITYMTSWAFGAGVVQEGAFGSTDFGSSAFGEDDFGADAPEASCSGQRQGGGDMCAFGTNAFGGSNPGRCSTPTGASSPTPLEVLAGHGVEAAVEEAVQPSSRESPRISAATEILETEDDTPLEEEEVESVRGTPTGVLCKQVVPLLRYLDLKATKYADPRHRGFYVELVRNRTRIKVATNPELEALDQKYRQL
ncbi:hypothetical protein AXG93_4123s1000 [Marchantia polymorpha subsp. ruderalis]|uniref:Uncharacterized protein n=1 Tax=Marchantia polymorpha subsp. ruderalis TaxID=1480154 RepID=A0A176WLR4_MARPO|nr:hypothetical protein AXG93_4123s1000 [Marchantia polymorpha subsp. ruderalis]